MSDNYVDLSLIYVFKSSTQKCDHAQYIQPDDFSSDSYTHFSDKSTKGSVKSTKLSFKSTSLPYKSSLLSGHRFTKASQILRST